MVLLLFILGFELKIGLEIFDLRAIKKVRQGKAFLKLGFFN